MQSQMVTVTTKVQQDQPNLKVTVRLSRNMDAVSGKCSVK